MKPKLINNIVNFSSGQLRFLGLSDMTELSLLTDSKNQDTDGVNDYDEDRDGGLESVASEVDHGRNPWDPADDL